MLSQIGVWIQEVKPKHEFPVTISQQKRPILKLSTGADYLTTLIHLQMLKSVEWDGNMIAKME